MAEPPTVSVVLPTLNAERYLDECLGALFAQDYPRDRLEVLMPDAGSTDRTREIAAAHGVDRILDNPLRSGEAGKAVGVKAATGDLVLLLDSDNILVGTDWLQRMVAPFEDPEVIGCEPARFHYRRQDHPINRWHALIGAADPLTLYTGNYARDSLLTGTWTALPHRSERRDGWERITLVPGLVPVLGANGFVMRRSMYERHPVGDYLFDLDYVADLVAEGHHVVARADVAIRHYFCDGVGQFRRKTRRRADDFFYFRSTGQRTYDWTGKRRQRGVVDFILCTVLLLPQLGDVVRGMRRRPDPVAWAWHIAACWITLVVYAFAVIRGRLRPKMLSRENWRQ